MRPTGQFTAAWRDVPGLQLRHASDLVPTGRQRPAVQAGRARPARRALDDVAETDIAESLNLQIGEQYSGRFGKRFQHHDAGHQRVLQAGQRLVLRQPQIPGGVEGTVGRQGSLPQIRGNLVQQREPGQIRFKVVRRGYNRRRRGNRRQVPGQQQRPGSRIANGQFAAEPGRCFGGVDITVTAASHQGPQFRRVRHAAPLDGSEQQTATAEVGMLGRHLFDKGRHRPVGRGIIGLAGVAVRRRDRRNPDEES